MSRFRRHRSDLIALLLLLGLALLWFAPVLFPALGGRTLLPFDNLYAFEPWHSLNPGVVPHNALVSDLVLENMVWKQHIRETLMQGDLPLWNPKILAGIPFLAAGQASTFYPLNVLFYTLPLDMAYGWFTALQVAIAGMAMYVFGRVLKMRPAAALLSGAAYMFSGFLIVSVVFTMFLAAVPWLPLLLAIVERVIGKQEEKGVHPFSPIPYVAAGAVVLGLVALAGHPELIYYTLIVAGLYALVRLIAAWRWLGRASDRSGRTSTVVRLGAWLAAMAALGMALGAIQLIPLVELLPLNFRQGSTTLAQVREWAWPSRQIVTFALPNFFGNPSHHQWYDLWARAWQPATVNALGQPATTIDWGIKNYVEGGNYLGIAIWLLAAVAALTTLFRSLRRTPEVASPEAAGPEAIIPVAGDFSVEPPPAANSVPDSVPDSAPDSAPRFVWGWRPVHVWFFGGLALVSLLFAFGTPAYALLFYGLPGWSQLHSPFRWVFPFTICMATLGGMGLDVLLRGLLSARGRWIVRLTAALAMVAGLGALIAVAASAVIAAPFVALGDRVLAWSDLARAAFADGRMFWGYQAGNLVQFGLSALLAGLLVWMLAGERRSMTRCARWAAGALVALVVVDLFAAHGRFNPASDVTLSPYRESGTPPVVRFLNEREANDTQPWRFTTFDLPGEKTFNANVGMIYGWQDLRGYDSIIPRLYAQTMDQIAPQTNELLYNRIAPLYAQPGGNPYAVLDNPLLDALNVKYILTEHVIPNASWQEIYRDDAIAVYENLEVLPRARVVPAAKVIGEGDRPALDADLKGTVFLNEQPDDPASLVPASAQLADAHISRATANELFIDLNLSDRGWLLVADAWFPGWKAYIRPFGADESQETELRLYRADGVQRAVYVPHDGQWTVRLVYSPMSFKLGLYVSFLAAMTLLFLCSYWLWGRYYRPEVTAGEVRTVAKNSLVPIALSLSNKAIDFAFAMLYVRILGPAGTGKWYFVVAIYGFFEIVSRYGLGTLLTRDVAEDKNRSSLYLTNVIALRTWLWLAVLPVMAAVTWFYRNLGSFDVNVFGYRLFGGGSVNVQPIGVEEVAAIGILALAMLFANYADAFSSMFYAFEKMEYPAGLTNAVALLKVALGALVLLLGWSFVGLAGVSLVVNILQVIWLFWLVRSTLFKPQWVWSAKLQGWMLRVSGPLMINHLLATIFWRIDVWILRPLAGAVAVGLYSVGLKYLDGLNIIPSMFTMALFPLMSRYARGDGRNLIRSYVLSLRVLLMVALPIAVAVTFLARPLVYIVGGPQYLNVPGTINVFGQTRVYMGGADLALQVIIWSIPLGFANSVTQYVLIAVGQQHQLTRAFIFGVIFNVVANLILIPPFGYIAAAFTTILSELCLLIPFALLVRRHVGHVPWLSVFARPALGAVVMAGAIFALVTLGMNVWIAAAAGCAIYAAVMIATGALRAPDMDVIWRALPAGRLRRLALGGGV